MGISAIRPIKIKLNNSIASGMYIILALDEEKYFKNNESNLFQ